MVRRLRWKMIDCLIFAPCVGQVGTTQFLWGHNGHDVDCHPGIVLFKFLVCAPPMGVVCVSAYKLNAPGTRSSSLHR